ncbi:MAG: hypothetical protein LC105_12195 [Chitinophagales bacterium]|nr:hypothetical protein [Chitinophagales bacterium]
MNRIYLFSLILVIFSSCKEQVSENSAVEFYDNKNAEIEEQNRILREQQEQLQQQLDEQKRQKELELEAENNPVVISNFRIENCTRQGTVLNSGGLYDRNDVKFIRWSVDYIDNVVKAGGKTYGTLYAKYMKKNDYAANSWSTFDYQGSFTEISNTTNGYTRSYNMVDDGAEDGTWSYGIGSEEGFDFDRGKWKIELYWDRNNEGKAIYLGGEYFEIY